MADIENSWILFELQQKHYGIPAKNIREMAPLGDVSLIPDSPDYIRGIINLRDRIIPVTDLRRFLGMKGIVDEKNEFASLLKQRREDHINWLKELMLSVEEDRDFKLTTDPHKCAFGKWYDSFKTDNVYLNIILRKFDEPHKKIHSIGIKVDALRKFGHRDNAIKIIEITREHELAKMIHLFEQAIIQLNDYKEIVLIIEKDEQMYGLVVDSVSAVTEIPKENIEETEFDEISDTNGYIRGIAKIDGVIEVLLNLPSILFIQEKAIQEQVHSSHITLARHGEIREDILKQIFEQNQTIECSLNAL